MVKSIPIGKRMSNPMQHPLAKDDIQQNREEKNCRRKIRRPVVPRHVPLEKALMSKPSQ